MTHKSRYLPILPVVAALATLVACNDRPRGSGGDPARVLLPRAGTPAGLDRRRERARCNRPARPRRPGGVRPAGAPHPARPRPAARDPGDRARPGRDGLHTATRDAALPGRLRKRWWRWRLAAPPAPALAPSAPGRALHDASLFRS